VEGQRLFADFISFGKEIKMLHQAKNGRVIVISLVVVCIVTVGVVLSLLIFPPSNICLQHSLPLLVGSMFALMMVRDV